MYFLLSTMKANVANHRRQKAERGTSGAVCVVAVQARLASNCGIFTVVKIGVVDPLPDTKKLSGVPVPQPVGEAAVLFLRKNPDAQEWLEKQGVDDSGA